MFSGESISMEMSLGDGGADTGWSNFSWRILHRKRITRMKNSLQQKSTRCPSSGLARKVSAGPAEACLETSPSTLLSQVYGQSGKISLLLWFLCDRCVSSGARKATRTRRSGDDLRCGSSLPLVCNGLLLFLFSAAKQGKLARASGDSPISASRLPRGAHRD